MMLRDRSQFSTVNWTIIIFPSNIFPKQTLTMNWKKKMPHCVKTEKNTTETSTKFMKTKLRETGKLYHTLPARVDSWIYSPSCSACSIHCCIKCKMIWRRCHQSDRILPIDDRQYLRKWVLRNSYLAVDAISKLGNCENESNAFFVIVVALKKIW